MSIYADNYIVDVLTGEKKLIKHLNKLRVDRSIHNKRSCGWNKSGKKQRKGNLGFFKGDKKRIYKIIKKQMDNYYHKENE